MIKQKRGLLSTLNHISIAGFFVFCLVAVLGTIGCSNSGGSGNKTGYHLSGYDGVVTETSGAQQSLASAIGNKGLEFYAEFPWFVNLTYQVFDVDQNGVADLTVDDFIVLEDGVELSKLTSEMNIRKRDALPSDYSYDIKTVLFLDNTPSSPVSLEKMLEAGQVMVDNMDEKQQQKIAIAAYNEAGQAEVVQNFTSSMTALYNALSLTDGIKQSYGTTNFYQGVIELLSLWEDNHSSANPAFQQGFLVAVTDGKDTTSLADVDDAIAVRGDKQVIVVAVGNDIPDNILNDLERLGNGGFYHVTDPQIEPDAGNDGKENLCENMLLVQNQMMAYVDGFYWLRYKTLITSENSSSTHTVNLSVVDNGNKDADSEIAGTFNRDVLFSGEPSIYFNTSASDPDGITEKVIMIERGQGAGEVTETLQALTYNQSGSSPSQYEWTSDKGTVVTVTANSATSAKATVTVVGPGDAVLTVKDTKNNVTQTFPVKVEVRTESFEMMKHVVTSKGPWFADATFQVRNTDSENNQWNWITDLAREDMTVMENGVKINMENSELHLRKRDDIPSDYTYTLKTVLLIDNSPSARTDIDNLPLIKNAAKAFVKRALVDDPADNTDLGPLLDIDIVDDPYSEFDGHYQQEIAVVSYDENGETIIVRDFTTDQDTVNAAIDGIVRGFGPIDFYGGMLDSLHLWDNDQSPYYGNNTAFVQGVLIVLSDGWQSNPGFYDQQAVLKETGDKQIVCVSVGNDLLSKNSEDLVAFGNAGYYSVPDPGQTITLEVTQDNGKKSKDVTYTILEKTLMGIQDDMVYPYANSFYWLDYKSYVTEDEDWIDDCDRREDIKIAINNNSKTGSGSAIWSKFKSCEFFKGEPGAIYVNSTVTDPDGLTGDIDLKYVMLGNISMDDPTYPLEAFTYNHENTPAYEWISGNENIVRVTVDPRSYANSRAALSLPENKRVGSTFLNITDTGNNDVFRRFTVNVEKVQLPQPIAYYPFNGNADDETGNGYDGEAKGGALLTADRFGNQDSAYSFDGKDDYIALDMFYGADTGAVAETVDEMTVCAWVKSSSTKDQIIISFDRSEYWRLSLVDYPDTTNGSPFMAWDTANESGGYNDLSSASSYADGQWHFICATYNANLPGDNKLLYVDGEIVASSSVSEPLGTGLVRYGFIGVGSEADSYDGLKMIKSPYTNTIFNGIIDDVIIFDRTLTQEEINDLFIY